MVERERVERRNQKERERKNRGESCCFSVFSPSPLLVRSSILRHSRRGLITAYHCCHGNSRSVKNLSALTLIVRLKFHGERVEFTLRTIDGTPVTRGYDGGIEYRLEEEIPRKVYTEGIRKTRSNNRSRRSWMSCIARNHVSVSLLRTMENKIQQIGGKEEGEGVSPFHTMMAA